MVKLLLGKLLSKGVNESFIDDMGCYSKLIDGQVAYIHDQVLRSVSEGLGLGNSMIPTIELRLVKNGGVYSFGSSRQKAEIRPIVDAVNDKYGSINLPVDDYALLIKQCSDVRNLEEKGGSP